MTRTYSNESTALCVFCESVPCQCDDLRQAEKDESIPDPSTEASLRAMVESFFLGPHPQDEWNTEMTRRHRIALERAMMPSGGDSVCEQKFPSKT